jgi:hypothetical protein
MLKPASAVVVVAFLAIPSGAAPVTDWKQVGKAIEGIPTAAGVSLKKRMEACKMTIHPETSWMETRAVAWPDYGAKPGETVVKIVFDIPPAPPQPGPAGVRPNPPQKNVAGIWILDHGKATALSSWAKALQDRPVPLGYDASNNC